MIVFCLSTVMARSYPADTRIQAFISEQYGRETIARLAFHKEKTQGDVRSAGTIRRRQQGGPLVNGLPSINPTSFGRKMLREERARLAEIAEEAKKFETTEEMRPPPAAVKEALYEGFTKEEKGRYRYLNSRKETIPETKYHFPITSSWVYGWKLDDEFKLHRPEHARTRLIQDSFFTRNNVPTLQDPTEGYTLEKSRTFMA